MWIFLMLNKTHEIAVSAIVFKIIVRPYHDTCIQHLSQQIKNITGFTPSNFTQVKKTNKKPLDKVKKLKII